MQCESDNLRRRCGTHQSYRILKEGEKGDIDTYIICPVAVYGHGSGPVGKASTFYKFILGPMLQRKQGFYVGEGSNIFPMVRVLLRGRATERPIVGAN